MRYGFTNVNCVMSRLYMPMVSSLVIISLFKINNYNVFTIYIFSCYGFTAPSSKARRACGASVIALPAVAV
jgi:hypothetical protein